MKTHALPLTAVLLSAAAPAPAQAPPRLVTDDEAAAIARRLVGSEATVDAVRAGGAACDTPEVRIERRQVDVTVAGKKRTVHLMLQARDCERATGEERDRRPDRSEKLRGETSETGFSPLVVTQVRADLAKRLGIPEEQVEVIAAGSVTWGDSSLGCPEPDKMYTQALVKGFLVRLKAQGKLHEYHGAGRRSAFYCARPSAPVGATEIAPQ